MFLLNFVDISQEVNKNVERNGRMSVVIGFRGNKKHTPITWYKLSNFIANAL